MGPGSFHRRRSDGPAGRPHRSTLGGPDARGGDPGSDGRQASADRGVRDARTAGWHQGLPGPVPAQPDPHLPGDHHHQQGRVHLPDLAGHVHDPRTDHIPALRPRQAHDHAPDPHRGRDPSGESSRPRSGRVGAGSYLDLPGHHAHLGLSLHLSGESGVADVSSAGRTLVAIAVVALALVGVYFAREILVPFLLAAVIAYTLNPLVAALERRGVRRSLGALLVMGGVALAVIGVVAAAVPEMIDQFASFGERLPAYRAALEERLRPLAAHLQERYAEQIQMLIDQARAASSRIVPAAAGWAAAGLRGI